MTKRKTPNQINRPNQKGYINERKYKKIGIGRIKMAGDFSIIVDPYLWKRLKNDDGDVNETWGKLALLCRFHKILK